MQNSSSIIAKLSSSRTKYPLTSVPLSFMHLTTKYFDIFNFNHSIGFSISLKYEGFVTLKPSQNSFPIISKEGFSECLSLKKLSKI
jgi:hypothetical protein